MKETLSQLIENHFEVKIYKETFLDQTINGQILTSHYWEDISLLTCDFKDCEIHSSEFFTCTFKNCNFNEGLWRKCNFYNCTFESCHLSKLTLSRIKFYDCKFIQCNFENLKMSWSNLRDCQFNQNKLNAIEFKSVGILDLHAKELNFCKLTFSQEYPMLYENSKSKTSIVIKNFQILKGIVDLN